MIKHCGGHLTVVLLLCSCTIVSMMLLQVRPPMIVEWAFRYLSATFIILLNDSFPCCHNDATAGEATYVAFRYLSVTFIILLKIAFHAGHNDAMN